MTNRLAVACVAALCALLAAAPAAAGRPKRLPPLTPVPRDALSRALARGELSQGRYTLERARTLFALGRVRREFGDVAKPSPRGATPILRDLAARFRFLSPADRATARSILSRPTDSSFSDEHHYTAPPGQERSACDSTRPLCFHWVLTTRDAPPPVDDDSNGVPDAVDATMATFAAVWDLEIVDYGFRPPLADSSSTPDDGGDGRTDIYLADLGGDLNPFFGYCTTDDPNAFDPGYRFYDVSTYCVVDDDFANSAYGGIDPGDARDVTAAHEFFHAIQFGYDWLEDLWLMEGTAMLMEGQFRPDVKDRIRYLGSSALTAPWTPVDRGAEGFEYGAWIYWRFLLEQLGELGNPIVIRHVWEEAAAASTDTDGPGPDTVASDLYSLQAAVDVLRRRGLAFSTLFRKFAWVNRVPSSYYREGRLYPSAPSSATYRLGPGRRTTGWRSTRLRHLASRYYGFRPRSSASARARLLVRVDLPNPVHRPSARLIVRFRNGSFVVRSIALDTAGDGSRRVPFGRGVKSVVLVLTNASARMICDQGTFYSCAGVGRDDLRTYRYRATIR